jgi:hypothetical protein
LDNDEWCPDCYQLYLDAFKEVPRRVEKVLRETDEVTAFKLEELEKTRWEATKAKGGIPMRRVSPGLFDMKDPSNKDIRGITRKEGRMYHWNYWSKDPEGTAQVRVEMERHLETEDEVPWVDLRRR